MASSREPQTQAGQALMNRALALNAAGHRAIPWGVKAGNEHDQPLWSGYFGDRPYPQAKLISSVWDRALGIGIVCPGRWIGLDTDIKDGKRGREHMAQLEAEIGPLPNGPITFTKSGGDHRIFKRAVIPASALLRSHVGLADGTDADIDVIHSRYRYFKVYDDNFWLNLNDEDVPELPEAWLKAIVKGQMGRPRKLQAIKGGERSGAWSAVQPMCDRAAPLVEDVRNATDNRNTLLNRNFYLATLTLGGSVELEELFRRAALESGLASSEVEATLASAGAAAAQESAFISSWQKAVEAATASMSGVSRLALRRAAIVLRETFLAAQHKDAVGMSCRQLAEQMNVSAQTANRYLRILQKLRLLSRASSRKAMEANRYRFRIPAPEQNVTFIHPPRKRLSRFITQDVDGQHGTVRLHQLLQHDAFTKYGKGISLAKSCGDVLLVLEGGTRSLRDVVDATGKTRTTIKRAVQALLSGGLLDQAEDQSEIWLTGPNAVTVLDEWVTHMRLGGRGGMRRDEHARQRDRYGFKVRRWEKLHERRAERQRLGLPS
ncbi:MAG: hypothetical protein F2840_12715 [Actinobacteria bacterium]|nr:hypothetical protein [Actinomycetota bacterium]